MRWLRNVTM